MAAIGCIGRDLTRGGKDGQTCQLKGPPLTEAHNTIDSYMYGSYLIGYLRIYELTATF